MFSFLEAAHYIGAKGLTYGSSGNLSERTYGDIRIKASGAWLAKEAWQAAREGK